MLTIQKQEKEIEWTTGLKDSVTNLVSAFKFFEVNDGPYSQNPNEELSKFLKEIQVILTMSLMEETDSKMTGPDEEIGDQNLTRDLNNQRKMVNGLMEKVLEYKDKGRQDPVIRKLAECIILLTKKPMKELHPLANPLLVEKIMSNLNLSQLLPCRMVNSLWLNCANLQIRTRRLVQIDFRYDRQAYECKSRANWQAGLHLGTFALKNLTECLKASPNFPCSDFSFRGPDSALGQPETTTFFKMFGHKIKCLQFYFDSTTYYGHGNEIITILPLRRLLLGYARNVEVLGFSRMPSKWKSNEKGHRQLFPEPRGIIKLPKLTTLIIHHGESMAPQVLEDLINAAQNLEKIVGDLSWQLLDQMDIPMDKIKCLNYHPKLGDLLGSAAANSKCEEAKNLKKMPQKMEKLSFTFQGVHDNPGSWPGVAKMLGKIFESNSTSLTHLLEFHPIAFLPGIKISKLVNVKKVNFFDLAKYHETNHYDDEEAEVDSAAAAVKKRDQAVLPHGQQMSEIFPSLRSVTFSLKCLANKYGAWNDLLDTDVVATVTCLMIHVNGDYGSTWIQKVSTAFPNVSTLSVGMRKPVDQVQKVLADIFENFRKVQHLKLDLDLSYLSNKDKFCTIMDSAITGIPVDKCGQLLTSSRKFSFEQVDNLRTRPSICDLKNLKTLVMKFEERSHYSDSSPLMSYVAGIFGFGLIRNDEHKVKIVLIHRRGDIGPDKTSCLDLVADYVQVVKYEKEKEPRSSSHNSLVDVDEAEEDEIYVGDEDDDDSDQILYNYQNDPIFYNYPNDHIFYYNDNPFDSM